MFYFFLLHISLVPFLFKWAKRDVQLAFVDATFVCSFTQHTKAKSTVLK